MKEPDCLFCGEPLPFEDEDELAGRLAFDPHLGRLWRVCAACSRWNLAPFEARWETIEACERRTRATNAVLRTAHLALFTDGERQLIRVGVPSRLELADWRYSRRLDVFGRARRRLGSFLERLPDWPVGGYDFYGTARRLPDAWIGSPFINDAPYLSALFLSAPVADCCPSCAQPLFIHPAAFGDIRLQPVRQEAIAQVPCGLCGEEVAAPLRVVRPALRAGLAIVSRNCREESQIARAVAPLDRAGHAEEVLRRLARRETSLGELPRLGRLALWIVLDELAEAEALEAEWRAAESLARIADGELTTVPGFEAFRRRARQ